MTMQRARPAKGTTLKQGTIGTFVSMLKPTYVGADARREDAPAGILHQLEGVARVTLHKPKIMEHT